MLKNLKVLIKKILYIPRGVNIGINSWVKIPRYISNCAKISISDNCYIGPYCSLNPIVDYEGCRYGGEINIGNNVHIGGYCQFHVISNLRIESGAVLGEHVYIGDSTHGDLSPGKGLIMKQPLKFKGTVKIGVNSFVGYRAIILPGVEIGESAVVAAGSVVTKSVPPFTMVAGNPARPIRKYNFENKIWDQIG